MTPADRERAREVTDMQRYWQGSWVIAADGLSATRRLNSGELVMLTASTPEALDAALYVREDDPPRP